MKHHKPDWKTYVTMAIGVFATFLAILYAIVRFLRRRFRIDCVRKMEILLGDTARIESIMLLEDHEESPPVLGVSLTDISTSLDEALSWRPGRSRTSSTSTVANVQYDVFSHWTDGKGIFKKTAQVVHCIRVLVCIEGEIEAETYQEQVMQALKSLCRNHNLNIQGISFCIVGDVPQEPAYSSILRPAACTFRRKSTKMHSTLGEMSTAAHQNSYPIEVFPIICDVADYCLLLATPSSLILPFGRKFGKKSNNRLGVYRHRSNSSTLYNQASGQSVAAMQPERSHVVAVLEGNQQLHPLSYLVGLCFLALKEKDEAFVISTGDYELQPYAAYSEVLSNGWILHGELQGTNLLPGLLRLWALAVSHGSTDFIKFAMPPLGRIHQFQQLSPSLRLVCCFASRRRRSSYRVSYIDIILGIFLHHRRDAPIVPSSKLTILGTHKHWLRVASPRPNYGGAHSEIKSALAKRRALRRAFRMRYISKETNFILSEHEGADTRTFRPPSKEPCACHLASLASDYDDCFEHLHDHLLPKLIRFTALETLAVRIRAFYIDFLRNLNGDPNCMSGETSGAFARRAACEAYTKAAEALGHVVDHVRKYLVEIAEPQSYKHLMVEIRDMNSKEKGEVKSRMSYCVEVNIVGATNLRNAEGVAVFYLDESDPYCTVEFSGKRWTRLQTHVIGDTLHPVWNFQGVIEDYDFGDDILFQVWDRDKATFDDLLGSCLLVSELYERNGFDGTLMLSEVKGHHGAKLHVTARVVNSEKSLQALPRPQSLQEVLERAHLVHRKLQNAMRRAIMAAQEECEENNIEGAFRITESSYKTDLWTFVQSSTACAVQEQMARKALPESWDILQHREHVRLVDEALRSVIGSVGFDIACIPEDLPLACYHVTCDSFTVMRYVLKMLCESNFVELHSTEENWRQSMELPQLSIQASLYECKVDGSPHMVKIVIRHSKIVALVESTNNWSWSADILREVPVMCQSLRMQDPHNHPSRWCLSFQQLKELAKQAEEELGPAVYKDATMTDIVKKFIWKRTEQARMSYACLMNWQSLRDIDIFVSHAWKENFPKFVQSVEQALSQRLRPDEVSLWICSLALYQTSNKALVKEQIGGDLMDAPFDKALRHAREVMVVRNDKVDNYQRAWCVYEIFRARQLDLKITIAGPDTFKGGSVDIMSCQAAEPDDERRIKNAIVNAGLEKELNTVVTEIKSKGSIGKSWSRYIVEADGWQKTSCEHRYPLSL